MEQLNLESPAMVGGHLSQLDWAFLQRPKPADIEAIHPYPAKFIGEIPRSFIQHLPFPNGTSVFDPFCGSGTTLVEAQRAGIPSIGIDLNPIACLISRVKTSVLPHGFEDAVVNVIERARRIKQLPKPPIPNVDHWFKADVQLAVGALAHVVSEEANTPWQDQLRLTLSSILVRVSNQDSDTRYAAVEKDVSKEDVFAWFATAAAKLRSALVARDWSLTAARVIQADTLQFKPDNNKKNVGLVITSPPYPNAYEYWLYHKYRMWWLGFDPIAVKKSEIGARAHFFKKNHHTAEMFGDQMRATFALINKVTVKNAFVCFVVGRSKIHGKIVDNADILTRAAADSRFSLMTRFERAIDPNRKSFNLSHANIKDESILVFQKTVG